MTTAEIAAAIDGRPVNCPPDESVVGEASVDSRSVAAGGVFVAIKGERADGHDHVAEALGPGRAVLALVERELAVDACQVVVADSIRALGLLAAAVRNRMAEGADSIGITGSSGKTGTKDLLAHVLERSGATGGTVAPAGSYNNEIGLPLTITGVTGQTRHLVLEMGARGPGHLRHLCAIGRPTIAVVLNVGSAHAGEFGSKEATAAAKAELVEALPPTGVAILNAQDPLVRAMAIRAPGRVVLFGAGGEVEALDTGLDGAGRPHFTLRTPEGTAPVVLQLHGAHHVANALAVAAVAREVGMPVELVADALSNATARSRWRMEVTERPDGVTVVNDAYNANPESVRAALDALLAMSAGRRTWAVLGEMLELGAGAAAQHDAIGRLAVGLHVARLVAVGPGPGAKAIHRGAAIAGDEHAAHVPDTDAVIALLERELRPGDVVLVKASRGAGLERVALALLEPCSAPPVTATPRPAASDGASA